jgi:hypothetical protein
MGGVVCCVVAFTSVRALNAAHHVYTSEFGMAAGQAQRFRNPWNGHCVFHVLSVTACVSDKAAPSEDILSDHKFKIGQLVNYLGRERAAGVYQVTQLLPSEDNSFQYRIKNSGEPHERMVKEHELHTIAPDASYSGPARDRRKSLSQPARDSRLNVRVAVDLGGSSRGVHVSDEPLLDRPSPEGPFS